MLICIYIYTNNKLHLHETKAMSICLIFNRNYTCSYAIKSKDLFFLFLFDEYFETSLCDKVQVNSDRKLQAGNKLEARAALQPFKRKRRALTEYAKDNSSFHIRSRKRKIARLSPAADEAHEEY